MTHPINNVVDGVLGTVAVTSPGWLTYLSPITMAVTVVGGIILIVFRCLTAINEYEISEKHKKQLNEDEPKNNP